MEAEKAWQKKNREINEPLQDIQKNITLKGAILGKYKARRSLKRSPGGGGNNPDGGD